MSLFCFCDNYDKHTPQHLAYGPLGFRILCEDCKYQIHVPFNNIHYVSEKNHWQNGCTYVNLKCSLIDDPSINTYALKLYNPINDPNICEKIVDAYQDNLARKDKQLGID